MENVNIKSAIDELTKMVNWNNEAFWSTYSKQQNEPLIAAIQSLEKQIPKKLDYSE